MAIEWNSTFEEQPEAGKELIAKNPLKPAGYSTAAKQCKVMKFHPSFDSDLIKDVMLEENLTLWSYTE